MQWLGIGYSTTYISFFGVVYYNVIVAWAVYYFAASFTSGNSIIVDSKKSLFPWSTCGNSWNTECCVEMNATRLINQDICKQNGTQVFIQPTVEFWENSVLKASSGITDGFFTINWNLFYCLLVSWIVVFFCIFKGVKSSGKVVWFTATSPFILITALVIRGLTLPNAMIGIQHYLRVDIDELLKIETWTDAATQIIWSFALCTGGHVAFGSYSRKDNNTFKQCVCLGYASSFTSFVSGFAVFGVLGRGVAALKSHGRQAHFLCAAGYFFCYF